VADHAWATRWIGGPDPVLVIISRVTAAPQPGVVSSRIGEALSSSDD
jgi:hypothetical protein